MIVNALTDITNKLTSTGVHGETTEPMRAVRMIAIKKRMEVLDQLESVK